MFLIGFPLLIVPFAIYNMVAFLLPGIAWSQEVATIHLKSGADWTITVGELLVAVAIVLLWFETLKWTRLTNRSIVDHLLSLLLFAGMTAEFVMVTQAASGTFFLLLVVSFVDVLGGLTIRIARRDVVRDEPARATVVERDSVQHDRGAPATVTRREPVLQEPVRQEAVRQEPVRQEAVRQEPVRQEPVRQDPVREAPVLHEPVLQEPILQEPVRHDARQHDPVLHDPVRGDLVQDDILQPDPPVHAKPIRPA